MQGISIAALQTALNGALMLLFTNDLQSPTSGLYHEALLLQDLLPIVFLSPFFLLLIFISLFSLSLSQSLNKG